MAKMFYTLEEAAQKLGKTEDQVREMATSGHIQEFRDRDKLMFKVEQIDLLAGGDEATSDIPLALEDSRLGGSSLDLQDSGMGLVDSREGTGISAFDTDHGERDMDRTQPADDELSLEAVGSGSGLLDLTRESDDTSLGAELLEEVYSSDDNVEIPANASGIFEQSGAESPGNAIPVGAGFAPMVVDVYDGSWSGLTVGLMVGAMIALICLAVVAFVGISGTTAALATTFAGNLVVWAAGLLGLTIVLGLVGFFVGKATE
ncbi:MAG: helix-turn-helix domain-containing protein [Phycisphaerales bacterium]|nr:helix-turn-helix domain-containing protein [Phycisphaerales bacterium]